MNDNYILSIDIGGTNLRIGMVDPAGKVEGFEITSSLPVVNVSDPCESLTRYIGDYLGRNAADKPPAAIAVGLPGTIDIDRRIVVSAANIPAMQNVRLADYLEKKLSVPTVIDRDVNMIMRYDIRALGLADTLAIGCYVGTGFGNAISLNGQIFIGSHGVAGELGHIPYPRSQRICGCGNVGCVEAVASGRSLVDMVESHFPATAVDQVFVEQAGHPLIERFVEDLAVPVATEVNIIDPSVVVLGGGVIMMSGFPIKDYQRQIRSMLRKPLPWEKVRFVSSVGGQDAGVIGGAIYARSHVAELTLDGASMRWPAPKPPTSYRVPRMTRHDAREAGTLA